MNRIHIIFITSVRIDDITAELMFSKVNMFLAALCQAHKYQL